MANKKVTLSIDSKVYDEFRDYCEKNAIMLSKKVELFMKKELESNSKDKKSDDKESRGSKTSSKPDEEVEE